MVTPEFIIETMREMDMKYFTIQDANYNLQYTQFQPISVDDSIKKLRRFVHDAGTGMYRVSIYATNERLKNGEPKGQGFHYEVMITESLKREHDQQQTTHQQQQQPMDPSSTTMGAMGSMLAHGTGMMGGVGLDRYLSEKDRIMALQLEIQQLRMEKQWLENSMEQREKSIRDEYERKLSMESKVQGIIGSVMPEIMKRFPGGQPGINGISAMSEEKKETDSTDKSKVIASVNKLVQLDPKFPANIEKLAQLAEKNPDMYAKAVEMIDMFL